MRVICVDDEYLILQRNISMLRKLSQVDQAEGFISALQALEYVKENPVDLAFLDIDMPDLSGLELAEKLRGVCPDIAIVFLTAYPQYAISAFKVRAKGYLLKPVEREEFIEEIENAEKNLRSRTEKKVKVRTFGNFDLFLDDSIITFSRSISKEILAYLICKKGTGVSRSELASIIWEDGTYDRSRQKQLDVYIRSLLTTLKEYEIGDVVEKSSGTLRVKPELLDCDYYRYLQGDRTVQNQFYGEFLNNYSWAEYLKKPFMVKDYS